MIPISGRRRGIARACTGARSAPPDATMAATAFIVAGPGAPPDGHGADRTAPGGPPVPRAGARLRRRSMGECR